MKKRIITSTTYTSAKEAKQRSKLIELMKNWPNSEELLHRNLGLFVNRIGLMRILFMHELYLKTIELTGDIFEFGCRWGQNLSLFLNLRGIYEPYNMQKKIIGFDTFSGFPSTSRQDNKGNSKLAKKGGFSTSKNYESYLSKLLDYHASESQASHIKRHEIVKGDATKTINKYLKSNQQTLISLAYFDMDIYKPTKLCLKAIKPHLTKGSIIGFDEPNSKDFPGETIAIKEVFGNINFKLYQSKLSAGSCYMVIK